MKVTVETTTSRCSKGNFDARIELTVEDGGSYGKPPSLGAIDHALDGARKALVATIEADRKGLK